jgi:WD40 repeat protein
LLSLGVIGSTAWADTKPIKTLTGHTRWVASVAFHPQGRLLASGGHDGFVRLWDLPTGKEKWAFDYRSVVASLAFSPDGKTLLCGGGGWVRQPNGKQTLRERQGEIVLLSTGTGQQQGALIGHRGSVSAMAFTRDGKTLMSCAWDGLAKVWDMAQRKAVRTFPRHSMPIGDLALSPDEKTLAVTDGPKVKLYELATGRVVRELNVDDGTRRRASSRRRTSRCSARPTTT